MVFIYPRAIHRFPNFELVSFGILFGSQISYGIMGLRRNFTGSIIVSVKCPFLYDFRQFVLSARLLLVRCLSAICPFGHLSFGQLFFRSFVFRPYVLSAICPTAICPTTYKTTCNVFWMIKQWRNKTFNSINLCF